MDNSSETECLGWTCKKEKRGKSLWVYVAICLRTVSFLVWFSHIVNIFPSIWHLIIVLELAQNISEAKNALRKKKGKGKSWRAEKIVCWTGYKLKEYIQLTWLERRNSRINVYLDTVYLVCGKIEDKSGGRLRKPVNNFCSYWFSSLLQCERLHMLFTSGSFAITNIVISLNKQSISDSEFMLSLAFQVNFRTHTLNAIVCRFRCAVSVKWCLAGLADVKRHKNNSRKFLASFNFPREFTWIGKKDSGVGKSGMWWKCQYRVDEITCLRRWRSQRRFSSSIPFVEWIYQLLHSHTSTLFQLSDNIINELMKLRVNFC